MEISDSNKKIISSFVNALIKHCGADSSLLLKHGELNLFNELSTRKQDLFTLENIPFPDIGTWDLVLGEFPLGMRTVNTPLAEFSLPVYSAAAVIKSLSYISPTGYGIFSVEPSLLVNSRFRTLVESKGFSITAIFNTPENMLKPYTSLRTIFLVLKNGQESREFIGELEASEQVFNLVGNYFSGSDEGLNLSNGVWLDSGLFIGFDKWKIQQQISTLDTEYKKFTQQKLDDIAISINACKVGDSFSFIENSIYIPKIGTQPVVSDLDQTAIKHQNYFQVACKPETVNADYLAAFFNSKLGRLILGSSLSESSIQVINKSVISQVEVALPDISSQIEIVNSIKKLNQIKEKITSFENNLALNPISSEHALKQIDSMLEVVGELADADKVKSAIRLGESKSVEFKETLSLCVKKQTKEKYIEDEVIKTIAAFFNTDGGVLLIGVHDSGDVLGIDKEINKFYQNKDKFLLHFVNKFKERIGEQYFHFLDHRLVAVDSKLILYVECQQSDSAVYVDDKVFYVRTNPSTSQIEGPKLVDYIKSHFKN